MRYAMLAAVTLAAVTLMGAEDLDTPLGKTTRKFEFKYTATIKEVPEGAKTVDLWIPVPQDSKHQKITDLKFDAPEQPALGTDPTQNNKIAHWKLDAAKAKGLSVTLSFVCERTEASAGDLSKARELNDEEKKRFDAYLKANKLVLVGGEFVATADGAVKGAKTPAEVAKAAYDFTVGTVKYGKPADKPGWGKGSTQWACDAKVGNCTDFHALIMSIGRTKGVPVKFEMGFPLPYPAADKPETAAGAVGGYHCWAAYYLGGVGWVPVDASEAGKYPEKKDYFFGNIDANRVQFTSGRDVNLVPKQAGDPLNYFIYPYAEADGKSIAVDKAFAFKDLK
ncbi:MAG TPA: transglutaminase-like domain-containing protein [Planctomycetota bacterium]|nr:transglutaminase-like domain-containing protein [Planctomycetota bacterium]